MKIIETYDSIQGEGIHAGVVMSFVRLAGCNLNCRWCDTNYSKAPGYENTIEGINPPHKWICITGGEPLLQIDELASFILKMKHRRRYIEIETNGSIPPPSWAFSNMFIEKPIPMVDSWVVDIKLPSSGNPSSIDIIKQWIRQMRSSDQIKFVVAGQDDLNEVEYWLSIIHSSKPVVLVSPVMPSGRPWLVKVAEFCIEHNLRMSIQLHRIIWGNKKGV